MGTGHTAFVDPRLAVRGVDGLHVVDAFVMPAITRGNPQATVIAIAERAPGAPPLVAETLPPPSTATGAPVNVIVCSTPARSHLSPLLAIAADLVRRGHEVTLVTASLFADSVTATGAAFEPLEGAADFDADARTLDDSRRDALPPGPAQMNYDARTLFIDPIPAQHATLQRLLAAAAPEPVAVVCETGFWGAWPILLGAPGTRPSAVIGVGVVPLTMTSLDTAPFGLGLPPDASAEGRARNAELNDQVRQMFAESQEVLQATLSTLGAGPAPFHFDAVVALPDRFLALAPASAEYPRSDAPSGLRYIGPLAIPDDPSVPDPRWWPEVVNARNTGRRVVSVTQGTVANRDLSALVQPTLDVLADRHDLLVVATTGRDDAAPQRVPGNARVASFIPYARLLPHVDVLVTNGGYGGSMQALRHGVPMVLAGDTEDKMEVTARLAWSGAGITLATGHPTPQDLIRAIDAVLSEDRYRDRAQRIQDGIAAEDPFTRIDEEIAQVSG